MPFSENTASESANKISLFRNISTLSEFEDEYRQKLNHGFNERNIEFVEINSAEELNDNTTIVFILAPYDTHPNPRLIFDIIQKCQGDQYGYFILMQKIEDANGLINLDKGKEIRQLHGSLMREQSERIIYYKNTDDILNIVSDALKQRNPEIRIEKLTLTNMGHFDNLEIDFDEDISCLIGENGTGKTTILRALALAIVGSGFSRIKVNDLLKIEGLDKNGRLILNGAGEIRLRYVIDGDRKENVINFSYNQGETDIADSGDFDTLSGHFNLKSLILGFAQVRAEKEPLDSGTSLKSLSQAHINDLIPLINNKDDQRLESFSHWIANLYGEANRQMVESGIKDKNKVEGHNLIKKIFEIITRLTGHHSGFLTVEKFTPPRVIVSTYDAAKGIPLNLASQGFKSLIGWIGYFLQRLFQAFPLSKNNFTDEYAVLLIDEIDSYIHPKWQSAFLLKLKKIFPNTQFIVSTQSPLAIAGLSREQIIELKFAGDKIIALQNQVDAWSLTYRDILQKLFDTFDPDPLKTVEELEEEFAKSDESEVEKRQNLLENTERLRESESYRNELAEYETKLKRREGDLEILITRFKEKLKKSETQSDAFCG